MPTFKLITRANKKGIDQGKFVGISLGIFMGKALFSRRDKREGDAK
jgi:hypothetical protein